MNNETQLIFVYNAKSNVVNKALDFIHKIVSPQTYPCNLCFLTYDNFSERKEWIDFRKSLDIDLKFFYSDVFEKEYPNETTTYPMIYLKSNFELNKLVSSKEFSTLENLNELIQLLSEKLN